MNAQIPIFKNAWELFQEAKTSNGTIVTFCERLDKMLGGGIHLGHVTELAGPAGIGKSQLCFQLAVDVQIPHILSGVGGVAVYVDTECAYNAKRLEQIASAAVKHCQDLTLAPEFTLESVLSKIYIKRCWDLETLMHVLDGLEEFVKSNPDIKLIIVDSIAFHFRDDSTPQDERRRLIHKSVLTLSRLAVRYKIAVVAVNQITTRISPDGQAYDKPTLSDRLTQNVGDHILLGWEELGNEPNKSANRVAVLHKSSHREYGVVPFKITADGIRDV